MDTQSLLEEGACPFNASSIAIDKMPPPSLPGRLFRGVLASPIARLKNSYYFRDPLHIYPYIGRLSEQSAGCGVYQDVVKAPTVLGDLYFITEPSMIKALLKHPRLDKGDILSEGRQLRVIAEALGKFRLNQDKADMKPKRSVLANLLMNSERFFPMLFAEVDALMAQWRLKSASHAVNQDLSEFTLNAFLKPIMSYEGPVKPLVAILEEQIDLLGKRLSYRSCRQFNRRFIALRNELMGYLYPNHQCRTTPKNDYTNRLSGYIHQHHQQHEEDAFATGVNSGTLAGYLAPNPAVIATVYELGKHPDWQNKLRAEWQAAEAVGQSREDYIQSEKTLLHAAVHEVLRLHPSQPFLFRNVEHDFMINREHLLTKGSQVIINIYHSLRDTDRWGADAALFNPMRFIDNPALYQRPFLVYSTGPNNCTGQVFSRQTLKIFLQALCANGNWKTLNADVKHRFHFAMTFDQEIVIQYYKS